MLPGAGSPRRAVSRFCRRASSPACSRELGRKRDLTALDTSGFTAMTADVERLLSQTDLVLLDIKHMDDEAHWQAYRGSRTRNPRVRPGGRPARDPDLDPPRDRSGVHRKCRFRDPAWPISSRRCARWRRVELLPYHELGKHKWEAMGISYALENIGPPSPETMTELTELFRNRAIRVSVAA